jgi:MoaD family protein
MPQVKLFGILRQQAGAPQLAFSGETVRIILHNLCNEKPDLCTAIFTPDLTSLRPHIRVMLNGRDIEMLQGFETPVSESDTLAIIPPIAGGFS